MKMWQTALRRFTLSSSLPGILLCACVTHAAFAASSVLHKKAPEFVRTDFNDKSVDLNAYRGKVVLLNFWATWCAPCRLEMPRFVSWQSRYGPRGLQIVGISMDDDSDAARSLYEKLKLNYPVAMGDEGLGELYGGVSGRDRTEHDRKTAQVASHPPIEVAPVWVVIHWPTQVRL